VNHRTTEGQSSTKTTAAGQNPGGIVRSKSSLLLVSSVISWALGCLPLCAAEAASLAFDAKGVKIHYLLAGHGEPVVLIHGLYSSAEVNWQRPGTLVALAKDYQVIALDLPGHGRSDKPERADAYGLEMVEDVVLLLDHLKIHKAHIVGYSMGGMVALKLIATHPDRVLSGTLGGMGWLREGGGLQRVWEHLSLGRSGGTPSVCVSSIGKLAVAEDVLKAVKVPVLVLVGDRDPVKKLYVAPLQAVRKDWPVVEIPGAGHLNCIFKQEFIEGIVHWLGQHRQK
jgi:pimeloyl-ACP methyl ester carboxylesterase